MIAESTVLQYVSKLQSFSSQYGSPSSNTYTTSNITGPPKSLGKLCDSVNSLVFRTYGPWWDRLPSSKAYPAIGTTPKWFKSVDFIDLEFDVAVYPTKVYLYETFCPGALVRILVSDLGTEIPAGTAHLSRWKTIWKGGPVTKADKYNIFIPKLPKIKKRSIATKLIRLEFNSSLCEYYTELDAVRLEGYVWSKGKKPSFLYKKRVFESVKIEVPTELLESLTIEDKRIKAEVDETKNYFVLLPLEVVYNICRYVPLASRSSLSCVSTLFNAVLSDPVLYKELNLKPYWKTLTSDKVEALIEKMKCLEKLDLSWSGNNRMISSESMLRVVSSVPHLTQLRLSNCSVSEAVVQAVAATCPHLKVLDLTHCFPAPYTLQLDPLAVLSKLEYLNISDCAVELLNAELFFSSLGGLQWFIASGTVCTMENGTKESLQEVIRMLAKYCKGLCGLNLWRFQDKTDWYQRLQFSLLENLTREVGLTLRELDLGWMKFEQFEAGSAISTVAKNCPNLEVLILTAVRRINDADIAALARHCPKLRQLDLLGASATADQISELLSSLEEMEFLDLSYCHTGITADCIGTLQECHSRVNIKHVGAITIRDSHTHNLANSSESVDETQARYYDIQR